MSRPQSLARADIRRLKKAIRSDSGAEAAELLLADSIRKGHDKLALHRYLTLQMIDASRCRLYENYCLAVARLHDAEALQRIFRHIGGAKVARMALPSLKLERSEYGN